MEDVEEFCPENQSDWRNWLVENHKTRHAIWVIFFKKKSEKHNLDWSQSVDEALCFGWIDSTKKTIDDEKFKQYFSKRKPKSNWSKVNKDKVKELIDKDLMQDAGYESIQIAKENGSWTFLDAIEALQIPNDLQLELEKQIEASNFYNQLSNSKKKIILYWVISAKREDTRRKRILEVVENARQEMIPKQFR